MGSFTNKPTEMTNNKQYTAVDFIYDELKKYVRYDNRNAVETFDRIFEQAKERYNDEMESSIIEICAEKSTSEANKYAEGYKEGYQRALDYISDTIKNKIQIPEHGIVLDNCLKTTGTNTTFLCTQFISDGSKGTTLPRCIQCGKPQYQHPIITNTI